MHGGQYVRSWSKTQSLVALSSAESELYAIVKTRSQVLGMRTILKELGKPIGAIILSDASAALGIIQRQGLGKLRHVDCSFLFVQTLNAEKVIRFRKVAGSMNPADLCTKGLTADRSGDHVYTAGGEFRQGRSSVCPKLLHT